MARQKTGAALIVAIWNSKCAETKTRIPKGNSMVYDYDNKLCYLPETETAKRLLARQADRNESDAMKGYETAQENAYFDNFCSNNNI